MNCGMTLMVSHPAAPSFPEQIALFARTGFDSLFIGSGLPVPLKALPETVACASANGICLEAFHASTDMQNAMWAEGSAGEARVATVKAEIAACAQAGIGKIVLHVAHGPDVPPSAVGLKRFARLDDYAEANGVCICYENSGTVPLLRAVLAQAKPCHGYCYDSGHHFCWAPKEPLLEDFGDRLRYTHLHDNMGIPAGEIRGTDMHLLPFDGKIDWLHVTTLLRAAQYTGTLNLELSCKYAAQYRQMPFEAYVAEAKARLVRLQNLVQ